MWQRNKYASITEQFKQQAQIDNMAFKFNQPGMSNLTELLNFYLPDSQISSQVAIYTEQCCIDGCFHKMFLNYKLINYFAEHLFL